MTLHWERLCVRRFVCVWRHKTAVVFVVTKGLQAFKDSEDRLVDAQAAK